MRIELVKELSPTERMLYFIRERESIRLKRIAGKPKPWTDDRILQSYRFCNVRRMDDKVSQWLLDNWYTKHFDHPNMLVACTLARHFNKPDALSCVTNVVFGREYLPDAVKQIMRSLKAKGHKIFNGAYMVRGIGTTDKTEMVVDKVCQPLIDKPPQIDYRSMQKSVEALLPYWGFSTFMAGQVIADMRWATTGSWEDRCEWAPVGPGSARGLNRLYGNNPKTPMSQEAFLEGLQLDVINVCKRKLPPSITSRLEAIDYQNCLCEFDKLCRTLDGEGRPKQTYQGAA